jgi:uncharacterized protein (TIGR02246 family)
MSESDIAGELVAGFAGAWNRNDMDALMRVFDDDAGFVDVRGAYVSGRREIRRQHDAELAGPYAGSVLRAEVVDARQPAAGVIVGHARIELDLAGQTRGTFLTFVLERRAGRWLITEAHNSIVVPPSR